MRSASKNQILGEAHGTVPLPHGIPSLRSGIPWRGPAKHRMQLLTHRVNWLFSSSNVIQASLAAAGSQKQPVAYATSCIPFCGGGGIRTPGTLPFNSFQDCRHRPLGHTSSILTRCGIPSRRACLHGSQPEQDCKCRDFYLLL